MQWAPLPTLTDQQVYQSWFINILTKCYISKEAILSVILLVGCSQTPEPTVAPQLDWVNKNELTFNQTVPGSYIVTAPGDGVSAIRRVFAPYGILLVNLLGNEQFEMRLDRDPGLDALKSLSERTGGAIKAIQPNFVYHTN